MEPLLPHASARKGPFVRLEAWSAVFIAVTSLAITLYEATATREHDRMSVWPRLSQLSSDSAGMYDRTITNVGLGPALVKSFEVRLDNRGRTTWTPVVAALLGGPTHQVTWFFSTVGPGTVLLPGRTIHILTIVARELTEGVLAQDHRVVSRVCYCSLYDECWTAASDRAEPSKVPNCAGADSTTIGR